MPVDARAAERSGPQDESQRLGVTTDALPVGIAYVDQHRIFRFANRRFAAAHGLTPEDLVGRRADDLVRSDAVELGDPFSRAAHLGEPVDFTHPLRHADGRQLTVRTLLRPDLGGDGTLQGFHLCSINATRQSAAEAALLQTQKMDAVGQLAAGVAHDFNNLLAVILGNLAPLREAGLAAPLVADHVEPAISAARQGARLTGRLLAIARRQSLRPAAVDVERCLAEFVETLRRILPPEVTVSLETDAPQIAARADAPQAAEPPPLALLDRNQFEAALLNLCLNARDAMPKGGRIRIALDRAPAAPCGFLRILVEDDGPGMDPATAAQAFEPFFTTRSDARGAGLGLSMVWGFVRQSGGTITLETAPGAGARFTLLLPAAAAGTGPSPWPDETPETPASRGRVLLVDDNHALRGVIRRLLARAGYAVIEAESGEEALGLIRLMPDLRAMVSDVVMPGMSGFVLAAEAARLRPGLGIVLMSGCEGPGAPDRAATALPLLRKPFEPQELVQAIEAAAPPPAPPPPAEASAT